MPRPSNGTDKCVRTLLGKVRFLNSPEIRAHIFQNWPAWTHAHDLAGFDRFCELVHLPLLCSSIRSVMRNHVAGPGAKMGQVSFLISEISVCCCEMRSMCMCHDMMRYACTLGSLPDWAPAMRVLQMFKSGNGWPGCARSPGSLLSWIIHWYHWYFCWVGTMGMQ